MRHNINREDYRKDVYRISKERLQACLDTLDEVGDTLRSIKPKKDSDKVEWGPINEAWSGLIGLENSMRGFRRYEDHEEFDDSFMYSQTHLDTEEFYEIEFKKEIKVARIKVKISSLLLTPKICIHKLLVNLGQLTSKIKDRNRYGDKNG